MATDSKINYEILYFLDFIFDAFNTLHMLNLLKVQNKKEVNFFIFKEKRTLT
jgi:hypothetical protein